MKISASDKCLEYCGRIDLSNKEEPLFVYPCSYVRIRFKGQSIKAVVRNYHCYWDNYIGVICDGKESKVCIYNQEKTFKDGEIQTLVLAENLDDCVHELVLFKRQDSCHIFNFCGFEIESDNNRIAIFDSSCKMRRRIEVYGDSVSAGEVSEAVDFVGKKDPEWHKGEFSNSYYSYSWILARKLNARIHDIAQGGMALLNNTGWFEVTEGSEKYFMGIESAYDKIQYNPYFGKISSWDFRKYIPHVVIVAIGQNDSNPEDYMKADFNCEKSLHWRARYSEFILSLKKLYPKAHFILTTTILEHDRNWDRAIEEIANSFKDDRIHHFLYKRNGVGTPGHIRIPEAEEMASELQEFIGGLGETVWED